MSRASVHRIISLAVVILAAEVSLRIVESGQMWLGGMLILAAVATVIAVGPPVRKLSFLAALGYPTFLTLPLVGLMYVSKFPQMFINFLVFTWIGLMTGSVICCLRGRMQAKQSAVN